MRATVVESSNGSDPHWDGRRTGVRLCRTCPLRARGPGVISTCSTAGLRGPGPPRPTKIARINDQSGGPALSAGPPSRVAVPRDLGSDSSRLPGDPHRPRSGEVHVRHRQTLEARLPRRDRRRRPGHGLPRRRLRRAGQVRVPRQVPRREDAADPEGLRLHGHRDACPPT
jgi:hypothetical protein